MKKVLIVEDDPMWADLLRRYVAENGAESRVSISAAGAIEDIDDYQPDLIILDLLLAGETGMALLGEMRTHQDLVKIPVIVCSSIKIDQDQLAAFGVSRVLDKSTMEPDEVRQALKEVMK